MPEPDAEVSPAVTVERDDSSVLLFALGRIPESDPLSFSGDQALAGRVKAWLPGP